MDGCVASLCAGMPAETAAAICSMIMGGVLERFPRLKVCFAHGGGAFPYILGRVEHGFNVRPDLCATENPYNPRYVLTAPSSGRVGDASPISWPPAGSTSVRSTPTR